jgi:TolB-like protein
LLPLLILAVPQKAKAQTTKIPSVAALDFGVLPGVGATQIDGRSATDAVALEMTNTGRYEITPRTVLNQEIQKQGLSAPFNSIAIRRLGRALGVDYIMTGDIVNTTAANNQVRVTLSVRLIDIVSGEFVNGSVQTGTSTAAPAGLDPDRQTQVGQAVSNAAFLIVQAMSSFTLPEATVLNTSDSEVYLNRGSRDGISKNLEMIVTRGREQVGKIRISSVQATTSVGSVVEANKGIKPEDHARAIVKLPGVNVTKDGTIESVALTDVKNYTPRQKNQKSALSTVIGVVGAVLLAGFLFSSRSSNNGAGIVGVVARAYADGSVSASLDPSAARVELRWQPAQDIPQNNILEYHIWRNDILVGVVTRTQTRFVDDPTRQGTQVYNVVDYGQDPFQPTTTTAGGTTTGGTTAGGTTAGGNNNGGGVNAGGGNGGLSLGTSLLPITSTVPPMAVGVTHRYRVSVLYSAVRAPDLNQNGAGGGIGGGGIGGGGIGGGGIGGGGIGGGGIGGGGIGGGGIGGGGIGGGGIGGGGIGGGGIGGGGNVGGGNVGGIIYRESALEAQSGAVTPLSRPAVTGPVSDQNMQRVQVSFRTTQGANQYAVEFSATPDFKKKVQKGPFFANFSLASDSRTESYDLSTDFKDLKAGSRVYYRVGARNSLDTPGPMGTNTVNGDDYIYSQDLNSFAKISVPPAAP